MKYTGKRALVCGMAKSGIAAAALLQKLGAVVTLQDMKERDAVPAAALELEKEGVTLYTGKNQCEFEIIGENPQKEIVDIGGHLCTSLDLLASDIELKKANIGDILRVSNAGAYCFSLSILHFASHDLPKEFLL